MVFIHGIGNVEMNFPYLHRPYTTFAAHDNLYTADMSIILMRLRMDYDFCLYTQARYTCSYASII